MQRLAGYLYQANPDGGLAEAFPVGTLRSDLPDWVKVDDGAFVDIDTAAVADEDGDGAAAAPKSPRRRPASKQ